MDEGSFAQVSCIVTKGDQPLTISWSFHGHDISSDLGIITTPLGQMGSSLMITSVGHKHRGTFTCKASNQAGNTTQSVELRVNGALSIELVTGSQFGFLQQPPVSVDMPECFDRSYNSSWSSCRTTACLQACRHTLTPDPDRHGGRHLALWSGINRIGSRDTTEYYYSLQWVGQQSESSSFNGFLGMSFRSWEHFGQRVSTTQQ